MAYVALVAHLLLMLAAGPVLAGLGGRALPAQPWRDLRRLFRKPGLWPEGAGPFGAAPVVALGASVAAALLVPSFTLGMATAGMADLVLIASLLWLPRVALALAGFDAGTGRAGILAQRRSVLGASAAPAVLAVLLVLAAAGGGAGLDPAVAALRETGVPPALALAGLAAAVALLALEEAGLEHGFAGCDLAMLVFAGQLRRVTALSLAVALLLPFGLAPAGSTPDAWLVGAACWAVKLAVLGAAVAAVGRLLRLRPDEAAQLAVLGLLLALIAAALFFAGQKAA